VIDRVLEVFFEHWGLGVLEVCVRPEVAPAAERDEPRPAIELAGYQFAFLLATQGFDSS
jgi:hypothetical protein